jgi:O-antigen ligase
MTIKEIFNKQIYLQGFTLFCCCFLVVGLIFSPFVLSLGIWGLVIAALWNLWSNQAIINKNSVFNWSVFITMLKVGVGKFYANKAYFLLGLLFFLVLLSGFWSEESNYWLARTRVRIPFLVLPFAFVNLVELSKKQLQGVLFFLATTLTITCIFLGIRFYLNYEVYMDLLRQGQSVPVPRNHIRFNLILATGIVVLAWLRSQDFFLKYPLERTMQWIMLIFMFLFIHVLAVRSGLVALYLAIFIGLFWYVVKSKRWWTGLLTVSLIGFFLAFVTQNVPSFKQKMDYMRWDFGQYKEAKGNGYSDSQRIISLKAGWQLFKENPILGVGTGDLEVEMDEKVKTAFPKYKEDVKLPHNQFVYILTATGIFGLIVSIFAIYWPLSVRMYRKFLLFIVFQAMVFASFLVEYTLETSIGAAFFLFFQLFFMKIAEKE